MTSAKIQHAQRTEPSDRPPASHSTAEMPSHVAMRWKLRRMGSDSPRTAHMKNTVRPNCMNT